MSVDRSYYDYGFKVKKYWICEDCQKDEDNKTEMRLTTSDRDFTGYEGLLQTIKELSVSEDGITHSVNFYDEHGRHTLNQIRSENILVMMVAFL